MSYHIQNSRGKRDQQGRSVAKALGRVLGGQGDQPKKANQAHDYVGSVMKNGGRKAGSKGSCHKTLGQSLGQAGGRA